jgi:hypothetical protein
VGRPVALLICLVILCPVIRHDPLLYESPPSSITVTL